MSINWVTEKPRIRTAAERFGVDARFVAAIRVQENGEPGREFGVLSGHATTYQLQLEECCRTIAHRVFTYCVSAPPWRPPITYGEFGDAYSSYFIEYFAAIWAPIGAANDPKNLNSNWLQGVSELYKRFSHVNGLDAMPG